MVLGAFMICLVPAFQETKIQTTYDRAKDLTNVRLPSKRISDDKDKYRSVDFSIWCSYPGKGKRKPETVNFELVTVVKARKLNSDLYVQFLRDGEAVHFGSSRSAMMKPVPGRPWIGERMIFLMPYDDFLKLANAKRLEVSLGGVKFEFNEAIRESIRRFAEVIKVQ